MQTVKFARIRATRPASTPPELLVVGDCSTPLCSAPVYILTPTIPEQCDDCYAETFERHYPIDHTDA